MISFSIDGKEVRAEEGCTILEVARYNGIDIPTLCFHEAVEPNGACRLCSVEVNDGQRSRVVASCLYPVAEGIRVLTSTDRVKDVRRWILEMLLAECPASESLKELALANGVHGSRFVSHCPEEACTLCGLCVRVCREVVGVSAISLANRGANKKVSTPFLAPTPECVECGTCVSVCPSGAMDRLFDRVRPPGLGRGNKGSLEGRLP